MRTAPGIGSAATTPTLRTTFRLVTLLRGSDVPSTFSVVEQVCPNIDLSAGDEWLLFLRAWDAPTQPPSNATFVTLTGPQGQLRVVNGRIAGPYYDQARVARSYDGAAIDEVIADIRAAQPFAADAAARYAQSRGWSVERILDPSDLYLRAETGPGLDDEDRAMVNASRAAGFPLEPYLGRFVVVTSAQVRDPTGRGLDVYVAAALFKGVIVGVWGWAWQGERSCGVFSIESMQQLQERSCP